MTVTINHTTPADGTFSTEGAAAWDAAHAVSGLGTMAEQNANNVNITGGSISGVSGVVTAVSGTAPIASSGGSTPAISISQATTSTDGYLSSTDWNTFNGKQPAGTYVTFVGATSPVTSTGGTTPTIAMPAATTSVNGYLTSTDWNTFNGKGSGSVTSVDLTAGTGISVSGGPITSSGSITVTNSAPMTYAGAGIAVSTGSAWGTSLTAPSGTIVGTTDTQTLTNKRVTNRIGTVADAATITPTGDSSDQYNVTALAQSATIAAPSGTPTDGQRLTIRLKDDGTGRALTWTTSSGAYRAIGVTLPTTTVASKVTYVGCVYNSQDSYWDVVAVTTQA